MKRTLLLFAALLTSAVSLFAGESITLSTGATLDIFQADAEKANGCAIIACPGGGYAYRADEKEGTDWATFMNNLGYTYAVLKYRLPGGNHSWPLADGRAAMKYLRDNAATLNIDPTHVGVMGFSAGGHLASTIATHTTGSERPAFQILFYPVITMNPGDTHQGSIDELLGANPSAELIQEYSNQLHVDANAPIAYITYSENDGTVAPTTNGYAYYQALQAQNIPATLKTYTTGGHGWSPGDKLGEDLKAEMQTHLTNWLQNNLAEALGIAEIPEDLSEDVYSRAKVTDWTDDDKTDWNASSAVEVNATNGLGANANLTATYLSKTFTIGKDYKVTYEVDWTFATATGREGNWNWIQFGDFLRIGINSTYNMRVSTDGGVNWNATALGYYYNGTYTKHIKVVFNTKTKSIDEFWFDGTDRTALVSGSFTGKMFNSVSTGFTRGGSVSWTLNNYLTTIVVTQEEQTAETAGYTINYKDGETIVKTSSAIVTVGAEVPVDEYMWKDDVKYKKKSGEAETLTIEENGSVFDIAVEEAATYNYAVKASTGTVLVSGSYYEQETITVPYRAFYLDGTDLYAVDKYDDNKKQYRATFTLDADNKEVVINATKRASNVFFYAEGEDITGATATSAGNNMWARSSNSQCGYAASDLSLVKLPAGSYTATAVLYSNNSAGLTLSFQYEEVYDEVITGANNWAEKTHDFTLTQPTEVKWLPSGDSKNGLDLIYICGTMTEYPATIGSAGWSSLFTPYALDFSGVEGLTAYTAAIEGNNVILTEVDDVPAYTGVILEGDADTYQIPVAESSATERGDLIGDVAEATAFDAFDGYTLYGLGTTTGGVQFRPVGSGSIGAGKAFLKVPTAAGVKSFDVLFGTLVDGINTVQGSGFKVQGSEIYNLAGQRMSKMQNGVNIVNGKKVIK